ncbi:PQQ-binding-like beta-propeller repeat protein [Natrinema pallidum]|nr:PQQ-binding-like beta-propeller repeat protein [Natrinema pallidum]
MQRRSVLQTMGRTSVVAGVTVCGCLSSATDTEYRWKYEVGGNIDAVSQNTVFVRERSETESPDDGGFFSLSNSSPSANGQVVALDAETGDPQWTYGETGEMAGYTELTVTDDVYFSYCGDDNCHRLFALERDGDTRWENETGGSWNRPVVADGVVYSANDTGTVWAFDADTGDERWTRRVRGPDGGGGSSGSIIAVADAVYVAIDAGVVALERGDGSTRWRYDIDTERPILDTEVADGVAYIVTTDRVVAAADGDRLWHRQFEAVDIGIETTITGLATDRLFVFAETEGAAFRLFAFDTATGERDRVSEPLEHPSQEHAPQATLRDGTVYLGSNQLHALDVVTGNERWEVTIDAGPIQSVTTISAETAEDDAVFVHADGSRLVGFTSDGERTWTGAVDGRIRNYLVDESVFVSTDEAVYSLRR